MVDDTLIGFFQCSRSSKKGDPLSSYLPVLVMEALTQSSFQGCTRGSC